MESIEDDTVRAAIGRALQDVKAGTAYMLGGLQESDYERILEEEMLEKFFKYVTKSMAKSLSPKNIKKTEKQVSELLQTNRDMWVQEIRNLVQETSVDEAKNKTGESTQSLDMEKTTETPKKSKKRKAEDESSKKNPKQKMPRRDSSTKKKSPKKSIVSTAELDIARAAAKKKFEEEKAQILAEVPEQYKSKWGQVGFAKWGKDWLPCLIVSPYDVSPTTTMREQWMKMFENTKNRRDAMTFLVYWYGYGSVDINGAYSFVTKKSIKMYNEGVEMNLDKLSPKIQKKIDSKQSLTKKENETLLSFEEMRADLAKAPEERTKGEWKELHEVDEDTMIMAAESSDVEQASDRSEKEQESGENGKPQAVKKITQPDKGQVDEIDFAEDEVSVDDLHDEDVEPPSSTEDDEDDVDFNEKKVKIKSPSKGHKERKGKHSIQRKRTKAKTEVTENTKKRNERKTFMDNEDVFIPMLEQLKAAIKSKDTDNVNRVLREMLDNVESLGAPFIEAYGVSPLLKIAKGILKDQNVDNSTYKQLWTKMGDLYKEKKALVPEGYAPRKREQKARKSEHGVSQPEKDDKEAPEWEQAPQSARKSGHSMSRPENDDKEAREPTNLKHRETAGASTGSQPTEAEPPLSMKRELPRDLSASAPKSEMEALSQSSKVTSQKPEKKSFSLSKLFNPDPSSLRPKSDESSRSGRKSLQKETAKILPSWITDAPGDLGPLSSEKVDRMLALEFFEDAAAYFPEDKCNRDSIARALEAAAYQWCQEQYKKEDTYWKKVRAVVAGICGKYQPGTLFAAIMAGEYASARDVVNLPDEVFLRSFEG